GTARPAAEESSPYRPPFRRPANPLPSSPGDYTTLSESRVGAHSRELSILRPCCESATPFSSGGAQPFVRTGLMRESDDYSPPEGRGFTPSRQSITSLGP